jgi:hypothetical protein
MGKSKSIIVSTSTIRSAFVGEGATLDPASVDAPMASLVGATGTLKRPGKVRGRIHPAYVAAFLAANPGTVFGEGENKPADRTVSLPLVSAKTGRAITPVTVPVSEAKSLAGVAGKRGRLSAAELVAAAQAYQKKA